ncbi:MAG: MerR family transcriptional regulator [Chloroflexi bacterium]|nr:MerR family transcriptional regulator [Chloroflexota bacterium]
MDRHYMRIGEVAERTGLTQRTLRFYEEKGLLDPPTRMEGGFRLYSEEDFQRIEHILQLKLLLGFSLAEVKQMVDAETVLEELKAQYQQESDRGAKLERVRDAIRVIKGQSAFIDQKLEQLHQMRDRWQRRLEHYREHYHELMRDMDAPQPAARR